jgi:tRNA (guanine37-N1)-methyltransferase
MKWYLESSIMKRAHEKGLFDYAIHNLTDWTVRNTRRIDDRPYGWGAGTILTVEPLAQALRDLRERYGEMKILYPSPRGILLDQEKAYSYAESDIQYCLICWHYEGIDERIFTLFDIEEVSIWSYVLSSGELASLVFIDSIVRLLPWVLSENSLIEESFSQSINKKKEYPQYSRPEAFEDIYVPSVLLSWDKKKISEWKMQNLRD